MQPSGGYRIKSELTPKERAVEGLIAASATAARWWGTVLRPGTTFAGLIILASGAMSLLKAQDIPDKETWVRGAAANTVLTVTAGAAMVVTFLIVIGYRRLLAANVQRSEFYSACRTVWGLIDETSDIAHRDPLRARSDDEAAKALLLACLPVRAAVG